MSKNEESPNESTLTESSSRRSFLAGVGVTVTVGALGAALVNRLVCIGEPMATTA